ncbi:MAG: 30S ribosomal protein S1 [Saprospiraceae bacterium]|nr:30S ribosomal protein S1 [Saprospiraceae bacterium]
MSEEMNQHPEQSQETVNPTSETTETVDTEPTKEQPKPEKKEEPKVAHDDFDWAERSKHELPYTQEEIDKYLADYESSMSAIAENEIVSGKVVHISPSDVVLDLNHKSDGIVSTSEFRDMPDLAVGDMVDVYVEQQEDERGQLVLSRRKAKLLKAWENIVDSYKNGTVIKGQVISKTKGGLIVDAGGLETFLPGSQIDIKPIIDYDSYVGKTMEFKVVKINEAIKNAVVSHKALIESDLAEQREAIISGLEQGQVLEGVVKNITDFGAFMDLGGVDGLLYITDISWGRINHPSDVLELNQKINVVVLDFDENKKRISLGLKQLQPHPWDVLPEDITEGSVVKGKIVNIEDYGAFLEITPGVEGLIHVSEISWSNQPINARDYFDLDQEFEAKIVTISREDRKMSLSLKQLTPDPWSEIEIKFPEGSRHKGDVKNLTPYGVFVELEDGIGGMVHISDLSWTKRFSHPSEFTKIGEEIDVVILEIDKENRKLSLGHKQIEENPWDTFSQVFPMGSYHEATVVRKDDKGAIVQLPYGLEAFAPIKHIRKEDGNAAQVDEKLTVKVIEFNRDDKRILVSHTRYLDDQRREASGEVRAERRKERQHTERQVRQTQSRVEPTTLGDMDVFSQLKEQLQQGDSPAPTKKEELTEEPVSEAVDATPEVVEEPAVEEVSAETPEAAAEVTEEAAAEAEDEAPEAEPEAEAPVVAEEVESSKEKAEVKAVTDDLKKIEGIGPKISQILAEGGVGSFEALAASDADTLRGILEAAGSRYKMFDPTTWPQQAALAAKGDWDGLKALQDELDGGKK